MSNNYNQQNPNQQQNLPMEAPDKYFKALWNIAAQGQQPQYESMPVGQLILAENRNPKANGQPFKEDKISLNIDRILQLISEGKLKKSDKGYVTLSANNLTPEGKASVLAKQQQGGNQGQGGQQNWQGQGQRQQGYAPKPAYQNNRAPYPKKNQPF